MITFLQKLLSFRGYYVLIILAFFAGTTFSQIVTNGSFEDSNTGVVSDTDVKGWLIQVATVDPLPVFEIVSDTVQQGNRALKVTVHGLGSNQWDIQIVADSLQVTPGATYNYSIWAKSENPGAQVNFTVGNYSYTEYKALRPVNLTTQWVKYTMQFTVNDNQTVIRGPVHFNYSGNTDNAIYIDNLQIADVDAGKKPVTVEAESGELGSFFSVLQDGDVSYITTTANYTSQLSPDDTNRIATYQVTFQDSGNYSLFVRLRVGANTFDDDSYFYARGFGVKNDTARTDWVFNNGLAAAGFTADSDFVDAAGGAGSGVWKWVNATKNTYSGALGDTFHVGLDNLTKTFQIASREDGLDIDKIAFGRSDLLFTVGNLDRGEPGSPPEPIFVWNGPPLASKQPKFVGNIYSPAQVNNFEAYWNQVTPENAGKWEYVEVNRDVMSWGGLDAAYNLAKDNDFPFRFHVLIYGSNVPAWIDTLQPAEQLAEIREWFQAVADRYPDIDYLEVMNEALPNHHPPDGQGGRVDLETALGGTGTTGWDWAINAFKMAREIFPAKTKLMFNDYNIINSNSNTAAYLQLIRLLQAQNLIDAVGDQGHAGQTDVPVTTMLTNLDSLASTGLPIQITEFDVHGPSDAIQLQNFQRLFPAFYGHRGVEGITLWGWRTPMYIEDAYLINSDGSERPALVWLRDYLDTVNVIVSVGDISEIPHEFRLDYNYPNPFNPSTKISWQSPVSSWQTLKVYDVLGNEVATLVNEYKSAGRYEIEFDASKLSSGVYFYQLKAFNAESSSPKGQAGQIFIDTKKMLLLR